MENNNILMEQIASNKQEHFFSKIKGSGILTEIFIFLNMFNANELLYVNKRFRVHLLKDNRKCMRLIGFHTYGLDKVIPFSNNFPLQTKKTSFQSNIYPIVNMTLMPNIHSAAISPSVYENGLFIWDITSGIYQFSIMHLNDKDEKTHVYSLYYIEDFYSLLVGYSDGMVVRYDFEKEHGEKELPKDNQERFKIRWRVKIGMIKPVKSIAYSKESNCIITLETNEDISLNFIKQYDFKTGKHIKSGIIFNCTIMNMKLFEIITPGNENNSIDKEYVALSVYEMTFRDKVESFNYSIKDTKLSLVSLSQIKGNLTEINAEINLYGHTSEIKDFIYIKQSNYLISVGIDLFIIIWDLTVKNIKMILDSSHEDSILSITNINDNYFATCGKDRNIFVWSIDTILSGNKDPIHHIAKHTSDIYHISFYRTGNELISGSYDKTMRSFKLSNDYSLLISQRKLTGHSSTITCAKFDYLNMQLITAGLDQCINYWDLKTMSIVQSIDIKQREAFDDLIMLFDDINTIIKIDSSKKVKCFNTIKQDFYHVIEESSIVRSILNLYDGVSFLLGLSNSEISFYNYISNSNHRVFKKIKQLFHGDENDPKAVRTLRLKKVNYINYDLKYIASGANDGSVCVFCLEVDSNFKHFIPGAIPKEVTGIIGLKFDQEEKLFAFTIDDSLYTYDIAKANYKGKYQLGKFLSIDCLNNNYLLASINEINTNQSPNQSGPGISIINIQTGQSEVKIPVSFGNIKPIYYMQNGKNMLAITGSPITGFAIDIITYS